MKKTLIVEPVICLYMFAYSLYTPSQQQYVYRRIWEETINSSFRDDDNVSHCGLNQSDPIYLKEQKVQEEASLFAMKMELCGAVLNIMVAFVLVANGDCCGRKISLVLPLVGNLISGIFLSATSYFSLPLPFLYALAFISGLFGGMATFLGGSFAFVVDLCENHKQKTIRIAVVDLIYGLLSGLGGLSSGFILKGIGFTWTFVIVSLIDIVNIFYVTCFLDDTIRVSEVQRQSLVEGLKKTFSEVQALFKSSSFRKRTIIVLLLCTFMTYLFTVFGGISQFTLYELNDPLCWNEIYIGYGSAASTAISLTSFLGIVILSQVLKDIYLVFIGIFSYIGGIIMAAFANTTLLMLLVRVPSLLVFMPLPVLRAMLSKVVLPSEQGALFACIACLEVVIGTISLAAFNSIYAETVAWFPGFSFLLSAGLCIIPLGTLSWLVCATEHQQEYVPLVHEEEADS
ncbi:lysosomal proton-coupled steroid conjugate and bile acid symporter SLC46A3 [Heteronotia binoei]|uniref:lysosomal proton-coupled steroid conjugate and bile acid symporter SLC46A3 n=1 Tax=Heteronotia binoei TaxID=13085 RepID=UPI00292CFA63|nr:lysosomal proton-coupled steroid conjugate and bile acid symporter SLC46A3 [Heteronotia binoei]